MFKAFNLNYLKISIVFNVFIIWLYAKQNAQTMHCQHFLRSLLLILKINFIFANSTLIFGKCRYYDDAACLLRKMFLDAKAPHLSSAIPPTLPWKDNEQVQVSEGLTRQGSGIIGTFGQSEELRCVIAIVRQYVALL